MLVVSRRDGEDILINIPGMEKPICVRVIQICRNNSVRIGVDAPKDVLILRKELSEQKEQVELFKGE